jgi:hypothetical protein
LERLENLNGRVSTLARLAKEERQEHVREVLGSQKLEPAGQKNRSQSLSVLSSGLSDISGIVVEGLLDNIFSMVFNTDPDQQSIKSKPKVRLCHQCHAPTSDPVHVGIPCGVGRCSLEHWQGCEGGITSGKHGNGKIWAGCDDENTTEESDIEEESDVASEPEDKTDQNEGVKDHTTMELPGTVAAAAAFIESGISKQGETGDTDTDSSSEDEELRQQREEFEMLKRDVEKTSLEAAAKLARSQERQKRKAQKKEELARQMKMLKDKQASLSATSHQSSGTGTDEPHSTGAQSKLLKDKVAEHEAKKARKAAAKRVENSKHSSGVTIGGIRALPEVRKEVEGYITQLKSMLPTLASDPTATGFSGTTFQPESVHFPGNADNPPKEKFVYVAELGKVIPMVSSLSDLHSDPVESNRPVPTISDSSESESECSEDENCKLEPEPGTRFVWKKHGDGRKYFKPVTVKDNPTKMVVAYKFDKVSGNYEQVLVPTKQDVVSKPGKVKSKTTPRIVHSASTPAPTMYKDHRVSTSRGAKTQIRKEERQPSFVSGDQDKQGKDSRIPSLVQFARDCPVSWTSKVTTSGLNPLLFSWAYIAELLATRTGQLPSLQEGELEARLQHFLSVLEVTLQTTSQTDFASESWKVARLYHQKVQDKIDSGVYTWLDLSQQWGTATLPHELMAANAESAPRNKRKTERSSPVKKKEEEKRQGLCYSWNSCEVKGKCKFEVENEGKKCNRQHYCSWCKSEKDQIHFHQKFFCKKKEKEAE